MVLDLGCALSSEDSGAIPGVAAEDTRVGLILAVLPKDSQKFLPAAPVAALSPAIAAPVAAMMRSL